METNNIVGSMALGHDDFVHDVQFDFYGNQIATCSSDQKIKIWHKVYHKELSQQAQNYTWEHKQTFPGNEGHTGAVWRVAWADPEFGENGILASCGYDKQVIIWSETESVIRQQAQ